MPDEEYREAFARIEREVERGSTDLSGLGFWRLVRDVKRDPRLSAQWAEVIGRIDRKAYERWGRIKVPFWLGTIVAVSLIAVLGAVVPVGLELARGQITAEGFAIRPWPRLGGTLEIVAAVGLSAAVHAPAHVLVGRLAGIRFVGYFVGGPLKVTPGAKVDYATYLRAGPGRRAAMHAAGALASKIAPFAVFVPVYLEHRAEGYELLPSWSLWAILGFGLAQIATDVLWSTKASDWKKVRRERAVARAARGETP